MTEFLSHPFFLIIFFFFDYFFFLFPFHCLVHWPWSWLFLVPPFDAHTRLAALVSPPNYLIFFLSPRPHLSVIHLQRTACPPNIRLPCPTFPTKAATSHPAAEGPRLRKRTHGWKLFALSIHAQYIRCCWFSIWFYLSEYWKKKLNGDCGPFESGEHSTARESPKNSRPGANPTSDLGNCDRNLL